MAPRIGTGARRRVAGSGGGRRNESQGDFGLVRSTWELHTKGLKQANVRNKSLDVFRRDKSGAWVIFRSINYPEKN